MGHELGDFISRLRREKGFATLRSFAKALGKSPTFMWKVERGESIPGADTLNKISELLGHRDELFSAARKTQPEIADMVRDPEVAYVVKALSKLGTNKKKEFIKRLRTSLQASGARGDSPPA